MKKIYPIVSMIISLFAACNSNIEEPKYETVKSDDPFEVRAYEESLIASIKVDSNFDEASNKAFPILFGYISGKNLQQEEIKMTVPVTQEPQGINIKMTAPVTQENLGDRYQIAFFLPSKWTQETLPLPKDSRINIQKVPPKKLAVIRYSGSWSTNNYNQHLLRLQNWIKQENLSPVSQPIWARYNSPYSLWFMRRNEIQIEVR